MDLKESRRLRQIHNNAAIDSRKAPYLEERVMDLMWCEVQVKIHEY